MQSLRDILLRMPSLWWVLGDDAHLASELLAILPDNLLDREAEATSTGVFFVECEQALPPAVLTALSIPVPPPAWTAPILVDASTVESIGSRDDCGENTEYWRRVVRDAGAREFSQLLSESALARGCSKATAGHLEAAVDDFNLALAAARFFGRGGRSRIDDCRYRRMSNRADALHFRGVSQSALGQQEHAICDLSRAIRIYGTLALIDPTHYWSLGEAYLRLAERRLLSGSDLEQGERDLSSACATLERSLHAGIDRRPQFGNALEHLSRVLAGHGLDQLSSDIAVRAELVYAQHALDDHSPDSTPDQPDRLPSALLDSVEEFLQSTSRTINTLEYLEDSAEAAGTSGDFKRALFLFAAAHFLSRELRGALNLSTVTHAANIAVTLRKLPGVCNADGVLFDAARALLFVRDASPARVHSLRVQVLKMLGARLHDRGQLASAERTLRAALNGLPGHDGLARASLMADIACLLCDRGKPTEAWRFHINAYRLSRESRDRSPWSEYVMLSNMAGTLLHLGDLSRAEHYCRSSLEGFERLSPGSPDGYLCKGRLAVILRWQGRLAEAEALLRAVIQHKQTCGLPELDTFAISQNLCVVLLVQGEVKNAYEHIRQALRAPQSRFGRCHPVILRGRGVLAHCTLALGNLNDAVGEYNSLQEDCEETLGALHPTTLHIACDRAHCLLALGSLAEAEAAFSRALRVAEGLRGRRTGAVERAMTAQVVSLDMVAFALAGVQVRLTMAVESVALTIERGLARSVLDLLQDCANGDSTGGCDTLEKNGRSDEQIEKHGSIQARESTLANRERQLIESGHAANTEERRLLSEELAAVRELMSHTDKKLLPVAQPKPLEHIREALWPGDVMLLYAWYRLSVTLVVIPANGEGESRALCLSEVTLQEGETHHEAMQREQAKIVSVHAAALAAQAGLLGHRSISDLASAAKSVLDFVLPPAARSVIAKANRVIVVPSGPLHEVPLDVLAEIAGVQELMGKPVVTAPSGSIFALLRQRGSSDGPFWPGIVGDPDFGPVEPGSSTRRSQDDSDDNLSALTSDRTPITELNVLVGERAAGLGRLPRALTEAEQIARYFDRAKRLKVAPLLGADATVARVQEESRGKRVLHFAAHAVLGDMRDPMSSAVVLAQEKREDGTTQPGHLRLDSLLTQWRDRLKRADLVVLSCCQTGRGVKLGDSLMALPIGFFHAGARCVIATLWKVDDLATCLLMMRFYQNYLGHHEDVAGNAESQGRHVWGVKYGPGEPMAVSAALEEAKRWLRALTFDDTDRFVKAHPLSDRKGVTETQEALKRSGEAGRPPFSEPCFWAAFVVIGHAG